MQLSALLSIASVVTVVKGYAAPNPAALPIAFSEADDAATFGCHSYCGYLIIAARDCTPSGDSDTGPWDTDCLCNSDSYFMSLVEDCLDCGWCLWNDYGEFLTSPLAVCDEPITPTGTTCNSVATSYLATANVDASDITYATTTIPTSDYVYATSSTVLSGAAASSAQSAYSASIASAAAAQTATRSPSTNSGTYNPDNDLSTPTTTVVASSGAAVASSTAASSSAASTGAANTLFIGAGSVLVAAAALLI